MTEVFSLFVDNLTILDCALLDPQRGPIGMSWRVGIEFIGGLNKEGVVFDFSYAKKAAKKVIDSTADHAFIIPAGLPKESDQKLPDGSETHWHVKYGKFEYKAPKQAFFLVDQVTENCIGNTLEQLIVKACKENPECAELQQVKITLSDEQCELSPEEAKNTSFFHYTHGLKEHYGNCQRLIHGHKSRVWVYIDDERSLQAESKIATHFNDKHLYLEDDAQNNFDNDNDAVEISYDSKQGSFFASVGWQNSISFPYETTIENISKYMANWLKLTESTNLRNSKVVVKVCEGIDKGCSYTHRAGATFSIDKKKNRVDREKSLLKG